MMTEFDRIFSAAIELYGKDAQIHLAKEECAELIVELSHYQRGKNSKQRVIEEIADVAIMLDQLATILGPEAPVLVFQAILRKVSRLERRILQKQYEDTLKEEKEASCCNCPEYNL